MLNGVNYCQHVSLKVLLIFSSLYPHFAQGFPEQKAMNLSNKTRRGFKNLKDLHISCTMSFPI